MKQPIVYIGATPSRRFHAVRERATNWAGGLPGVKEITLQVALDTGHKPCAHKQCREALEETLRTLREASGKRVAKRL